jgi:hypothetical protein
MPVLLSYFASFYTLVYAVKVLQSGDIVFNNSENPKMNEGSIAIDL